MNQPTCATVVNTTRFSYIFKKIVMRRITRIALRTLMWCVIILTGVLLLTGVMLYIPAVQKFAVDKATEIIKDGSGMDISIGELRLRFPLELDVNKVRVMEPSGDTMAVADKIRLDVAVTPLLRGRIAVRGLTLLDVVYNMGNADSAMWLRAAVDTLALGRAESDFGLKGLDLSRVELHGGDVSLWMRDTVTPAKADTAAGNPLRVTAAMIQLTRVRYAMRMQNSIDSLGVYVPCITMRKGVVDLGRQTVHVRSLSADSLIADMLMPSVAQTVTTDSDSVSGVTESMPWTVTADTLRITARKALYAVSGVSPLPGLDPSYIEVADVGIEVDSLYNRGRAVTLPLRRLTAHERSGLTLDAAGLFAMDSAYIRVSDFVLRTLQSRLSINAQIPSDFASAPATDAVSAKIDGEIAMGDVALAMPLYKPLLADIPPQRPLRLSLLARGTIGRIDMDRFRADLPGMLRLTASGSVANPMDFKAMNGDIAIEGALTDPSIVKPTLVMAKLNKTVSVPSMTLEGNLTMRPGTYSGRLEVRAAGGRIAANGSFRQTSEGYAAKMEADDFPVSAFMPTLGLGTVTADLSAEGQGFDFANPHSLAKVSADITRAVYNGHILRNIRLDASLHDGVAQGLLLSANQALDLDADFEVRFLPKGYAWSLDGDIRNVDMQALRLSTGPMGGAMTLTTTGTVASDLSSLEARLGIGELEWELDDKRLTADSLSLTATATDTTLRASFRSGDLAFDAGVYCGIDTLTGRVGRLPSLIDSFVARRAVDIRSLQAVLPPMDMRLTAGIKNPVSRFMLQQRMGWRAVSLDFHNDTLMTLNASALQIFTPSMTLDTLTLAVNQHGKYLVFAGDMNEKPGTLDNFAHVGLNGFVADDKLSLFVRQRNIEGKEGYRLGVNLTTTDSTVSVRFVPHTPTIAYKPWTINRDNYITLNMRERMLDADLTLQGNGSRLRLYTIRDSAAHSGFKDEQLALQLDSIHLSDWMQLSPFAPPVKGDVGANLKLRVTPDAITGNGYVNIDNLYYGRERVGSFGLDMDVRNTIAGVLKANIGLSVDSVQVMTANGSLNDSTLSNPFMLDFNMIRLPLKIANPFLPAEYARLSGTLNGRMDITGSMTEPIFDGYLTLDSAAVKVGMLGSTFAFSPEPLRVDSNIVTLDGLYINGVNGKPLSLGGTVDMRRLTDPRLDITCKASDMQIVNSNRARAGAEVYGKAFVDLDARVRGNMDFIDVNAALSLLSGTNVTYVKTTAVSALSSRNTGDMVQFVAFSDTLQVADADSTTARTMNMNLDAELTIQPGTTVNVDLSADGQNKVVIQGSGNLDYTLNPMNDGRMTGRFNIESGFVRYTPPLMSQKKFDFQSGSFVAFNGNMLNPILNIHAVDAVKANVTASGQNSRLVTFNVGLSLTNTLDNLNVAFDLSTDDDLTVSNELQSMSPEQRANQAMNLLLYNTYTGPNTKGDSSSANLLNSFLAGRLNSWAAQAIHGVDISFGINQYDKTTDGMTNSTTSYSYQVSKSLFNDRVKIIVGGNYSTDADADENLSQNLINDVSLEYLLNRSGTMYMRVFRHVGYESILEGEITSTGVGFVLRRKLNSLRDLFRFHLPAVKPDEIQEPQ